MSNKTECWCDPELGGRNPSCPKHGEGFPAPPCSAEVRRLEKLRREEQHEACEIRMLIRGIKNSLHEIEGRLDRLTAANHTKQNGREQRP